MKAIEKFSYELTVVLRFDDLETLPRLLAALGERVLQIDASKLDGVGGEESGARRYTAGWYDFNLRDRRQVSDAEEPTSLPIRVNAKNL